MRVFMLHVGNPVDQPAPGDRRFVLMTRFNDGSQRWYPKKDVVNAASQMDSLREAGIDISYGFLDSRKSIVELARGGLRLRREVRRTRSNVVHVLWGTTTGLMAVLFSPVPVVISFCGSDLLGAVNAGGGRTLAGHLSRTLSRVAGLLAARNITKSTELRDTLWGAARRRTTIIPNGVDLTTFRPIDKAMARSALGWNQDDVRILFFPGSGGTVKDMPLAEKVVKIVAASVARVSLTLLRDTPHEDLPTYYNACDLMLITSFYEGSNNSLKEAIACNTPVVSTDCGDASDRLQGIANSYVAASREPAELANACLRILASGRRAEGQTQAAAFSMPAVAAKVAAVYHDAVEVHEMERTSDAVEA